MGAIQAIQAVHASYEDVGLNSLQKAVDTLNARQEFGEGSQIVITHDERTHRPIVQVVDRKTQEVLEQISPPSIFVRLRRQMKIL